MSVRLVSRRVECIADLPDAPIHHIGRCDHVDSRFRLRQRLPAQDVDRLVIDDPVTLHHAVMSVGGERIERDIANDTDLRHRFLESPDGPVAEVVCANRFLGAFVLLLLGHVGEQGERRNAELGRFFRRAQQSRDGQAIDAGHGRNRLALRAPVLDEHRPDQVIDRQVRFAHQPARPGGRADCAAYARAETGPRGCAPRRSRLSWLPWPGGVPWRDPYAMRGTVTNRHAKAKGPGQR